MLIFLIVAGTVWLALAGLIVLALAAAARQSMPEISHPVESGDEDFPRTVNAPEFLDDTAEQEKLLNVEVPAATMSPTRAAS